MTSSLLLRLPGATVAAADAEGACRSIELDDLPRLLRERGERPERLTIVGAPPRDEIGFGLVPLLVAAVRPRRVTLVDETTGASVDGTTSGFVSRWAAPAVAQVAVSGAAIGAQRLAIASLRRRRAPTARSRELRRMLYLRSGVGGAGAGGSVTHSHEVIRAVRALGVEVDAVTTDEAIARTALAEPDPPCRWTVRRIPFVTRALPASTAFGADAALLAAVARRARAADVVYQRHGRFTLVGALVSAATGTPLFLEYNGSEAYFHTHWQATALHGQLVAAESVVLEVAARVIVVSEVIRSDLVASGVDPAKIVVNPNGVDAARFDRGGGELVRRELGFGSGEVVIGFVGSFGPWHGAPRLAEAFVQLSRRNDAVRLLLIGDGTERAEVESLLRDGGVADRVVFTGGLPPSAIPAHLDACDVVAAPHVQIPGGVEFFGSPTKLFEYMASGKAIVASRLGQIADVLDDDVTALLVEPGNVGDLASALGRLADDPGLRRRLGAAARATAVESHSWRRNAERLVEAYRGLAPG